ncbi:MAG: ParB/RepB/Spo0J family partition protein [Rhodospirillales bacterium]|nr:ParB/RepB/Spo0J family partition protein [Rhodospirillales bacterium]
MADNKPRGLGRGLSALLGEDNDDYAALDRMRASRSAAIEKLSPGRFQPRQRMDEEHLQELARSISEKGVLQPILVRRHPDDPSRFEIIAGERRWRAAQLAQLHEVPISVRELSDTEAFEIALVENLQRQDLSPLEEAEGYRRLMEECSRTQEDVAKSVGKSRSHIANTLRLLSLPESVKTMLNDGQLSAGHARAILTADNPENAARQVVERGLNVRQTEDMASEARAASRVKAPASKDADTLALERDLGMLLGLGVEIRFRGNGGSLVLNYTTLDQLDDILHRLSQGVHGRPTRSD